MELAQEEIHTQNNNIKVYQIILAHYQVINYLLNK
jgi:hypothetical protein